MCMSKLDFTLEDFWRAMNAGFASGVSPEEAAALDVRWGDVTAEPGGVDYAEIDTGGVAALWVTPHEVGRGVIVGFHGGGFVGGSMWTHRKVIAHLAKAAGARALIIDYDHSPMHQFPTQLDQCTDVYGWLLDQGVPPGHVAFCGDSAGGGLSISTVLRARQRALPDPAALLLISPWTDMTFDYDSMKTNQASDVLFGGQTPMDLHGLAAMYLGPDGGREDPLASPMFADLTGMPPMYVQAGSAEMLLDDARRIAAHAQQAGVTVELDIVDAQQHSFQFDAGHGGPADAAIVRLGTWVRPLIG
jgi:monoterpene epsilon-lactone hydrolase